MAFARAAGTLLTNYAWTPEKAATARDLALSQGMNLKDIVFGIDVWAQNSQDKDNRRSTYGGGGTGTGIAVAELARLGFSAGIFAPAWPFEHFPTCPAAVQQSMWDGVDLPEHLGCDCVPNNRHAVDEYRTKAITRSAQGFPAGSESFFYTNFERAFTHASLGENDSMAVAAHLGSQSVLPNPIDLRRTVRCGLKDVGTVTGKILDSPSRLAIYLHNDDETLDKATIRGWKLYDLDMTGWLEVTVTYRKQATSRDLHIALYMTETNEEILVPNEACSYVKVKKNLDCRQKAGENQISTRLTGIRLLLKGNPPQGLKDSKSKLIEILEICVKRQGSAYSPCSIAGMDLKHCSQHRSRLSWSYDDGEQGESEARKHSLPWSNTTGPVSRFLVYFDEKLVGLAYAKEYILSAECTTKMDEPQKHTVSIQGIGFDGTTVCSYTCCSRDLVQRRDEKNGSSWQLVQHSELC